MDRLLSLKTAVVLAGLALVVGLAARSSAADANVSGKWNVTTKPPRGERTSEMTVKHTGKVEGDAMIGTIDMGGGRTGEWKAEKVK